MTISLLRISLFTFIFCSIAHASGYLGVKINQQNGQVYLEEVMKNSSASEGGLETNDVITHIAGVKITSVDQLRSQLQKTKAGDQVEFSIRRNKAAKKTTITMGERPKAPLKLEGLINAPAPEINHISQWHNLPEGKKALNLADYKGKTVYLYCFQSWCPGCHSAGFPTLKKLINHYKGDESVVFLTVQTVFEGFDTNTFERGKTIMKKFGLTIPMGQDGSVDKRSSIMQNYRTRGTPWIVIIDPGGTIRYSTFQIQAKETITLIDGFKKPKKKADSVKDKKENT